MLALHPARLALAILVVLILIVWAFGMVVRGRGLHETYRRHFGETARERQFIAVLAFYVSFAVVRVVTHAIRAGRGPFHDLEVAGTHIHHLVWGILLLLVVGYGWLWGVGRASRWAGRAMALLYGLGSALTLDEYALWLNLRDVYWQREGRVSIDAVLLFGALLTMGFLGGPFLRSLFREARQARGAPNRGSP